MNDKRYVARISESILYTALLAVLAGCAVYQEPPRPTVYVPAPRLPAPPIFVPEPPAQVYVPAAAPAYVPPPSIEASVSTGLPFGEGTVTIQSESDFYEPLTPYGRWEVVGGYGRCWIPGRVAREWRPYCNGSWQRTEAGWYWASDEPWAWATYHYGRWDLHPQFGWYWVPQTQWAPAWVSWHAGGGHLGWAPLHPSVRVGVGGLLAIDLRVVSPRAFVVVEERRFLEPVRPATVVVNNTVVNRTVINNNTVNITNIKVVNNVVVNEGPRTQVIEQVCGRTVQTVPAGELRRKHEAEAFALHASVPPGHEKNFQPPGRIEARTPIAVGEVPRKHEPESIARRAVVAPAPERHIAPPFRSEPDPRDRRTTPSHEVRTIETLPVVRSQPEPSIPTGQRIGERATAPPSRPVALEQRRFAEREQVAQREERRSEPPLVKDTRTEVPHPVSIDPSTDVKSPKHGQQRPAPSRKFEQKAQAQSERSARGESSGEKKEHNKNGNEK